jgi:hypothetical protein
MTIVVSCEKGLSKKREFNNGILYGGYGDPPYDSNESGEAG